MKNKTQKLILFLLLQLEQLIITFGSNIDIPQNLIKEKRWKEVDDMKIKAQKKALKEIKRIVESRKKKIKQAKEKLSDRMKNLNLKDTAQK